MTTTLTEADVEEAALASLGELGWVWRMGGTDERRRAGVEVGRRE